MTGGAFPRALDQPLPSGAFGDHVGLFRAWRRLSHVPRALESFPCATQTLPLSQAEECSSSLVSLYGDDVPARQESRTWVQLGVVPGGC